MFITQHRLNKYRHTALSSLAKSQPPVPISSDLNTLIWRYSDQELALQDVIKKNSRGLSEFIKTNYERRHRIAFSILTYYQTLGANRAQLGRAANGVQDIQEVHEEQTERVKQGVPSVQGEQSAHGAQEEPLMQPIVPARTRLLVHADFDRITDLFEQFSDSPSLLSLELLEWVDILVTKL